jgi:hypothetical protein
MEQSLIFGIPFLHYKTKNWKKYRRFLQESFKNSSKFTDFWDDRSGDLLPDYCDKVVDVIAPNLQKFAEVINPNPVMITEMWYEKSKKGDKHSIHNHGGQGYSAVLYVKYNPEIHEPTVFYSAFRDGNKCVPIILVKKKLKINLKIDLDLLTVVREGQVSNGS